MIYLLPFFFALIPLVASIAPRGMATLIDTMGAACILQLFLQRHTVDWRGAWRTLRWVIVALAFIALSSLWSVSPRALEMLRDTMLVSVAAMLVFTASHRWPQALVDRALRWFGLSALAAFFLYSLHAALGYPLNLQYSRISLETLLGTNIPKRTAALFALLMWPAALCLYRFGPARKNMRAAATLLAAMTVILLTLPSRAAILGAILGLVTYGLATITPRAGRAIGLCVLPLAMPLMLAIALALPQLPPGWKAGLPLSGEFRLEIWNFAAHKAIERLPLGIGIDASRTLASPADRVVGPGADNANFANSLLPDHPHNVYLQLWLEGGLIGTVLTVALTALLWLRLCRLPPRLQPFIWGYAVTAAVTLAIAYGTWQAWWLGGHLLAAILLALLCRAEDGLDHDQPT